MKSGTSYVNAFATAGVCACSRSAFLTGKNQISIGSMHMRTTSGGYVPYLAVPSPEIKAFPEILRKFGYYTFTNDKLDYQFSGILIQGLLQFGIMKMIYMDGRKEKKINHFSAL